MTASIETTKWVAIFTVFFSSLSTLSMWHCFAGVPYETADFFKVDILSFNSVTIAGYVVGVIISPIALFLADKFGPLPNTIISITTSILASILRLISVYKISFATFFISQMFNKISQSMLIWLATKITSLYFTENLRTVANAIATVPQLLGIMLGYILGPVFIRVSPPGGVG